MINYLIWECEHCSEILVQVLNEDDLPSVQEHFTKLKYFIKETFIGKDGNYFFVTRKFEKNE